MESVDVRLARMEEHMVHVKVDCRDIKAAMVPMREEVEAIRIQRAVDQALNRRDKKWMHGISAVIGAVFGFIGHLFHPWS